MGSLKIEKMNQLITWTFEGILQDTEENEAALKQTFAKGFEWQFGTVPLKWLNDTENLVVMGSNLLRLLDEFVNKNVIEHRVEGKLAFVEPQNTHGKTCVKFYCAVANVRFKEAHLNVSMEIFKSKAEALNWLNQPVGQLVAA